MFGNIVSHDDKLYFLIDENEKLVCCLESINMNNIEDSLIENSETVDNYFVIVNCTFSSVEEIANFLAENVANKTENNKAENQTENQEIRTPISFISNGIIIKETLGDTPVLGFLSIDTVKYLVARVKDTWQFVDDIITSWEECEKLQTGNEICQVDGEIRPIFEGNLREKDLICLCYLANFTLAKAKFVDTALESSIYYDYIRDRENEKTIKRFMRENEISLLPRQLNLDSCLDFVDELFNQSTEEAIEETTEATENDEMTEEEILANIENEKDVLEELAREED